MSPKNNSDYAEQLKAHEAISNAENKVVEYVRIFKGTNRTPKKKKRKR